MKLGNMLVERTLLTKISQSGHTVAPRYIIDHHNVLDREHDYYVYLSEVLKNEISGVRL